jgi:hypothetical protein
LKRRGATSDWLVASTFSRRSTVSGWCRQEPRWNGVKRVNRCINSLKAGAIQTTLPGEQQKPGFLSARAPSVGGVQLSEVD